MGCLCSKPETLALDGADVQAAAGARNSKKEAPTKQYAKPRWRSQQPLTPAKLQAMRDMFWDTQPHYGGSRVIWDAIKAAVEAGDMDTTRLLIEAAGIIVARPDMTVLYDERGAKYELPEYVLSDPLNLSQSDDDEQQQAQGQQPPLQGAAAQQQQLQQQQQELRGLAAAAAAAAGT